MKFKGALTALQEAERLKAEGHNPIVLEGGSPKRMQKELIAAVRAEALDKSRESARIEPGASALVLIATGQYLGEGFDCPQIDTLFLAFPVSFRGKLVQYVGRLMRTCKGKSGVRVYDYADLHVPPLKKMHEKRLKTYHRLGFTRMEDQPLFLGG